MDNVPIDEAVFAPGEVFDTTDLQNPLGTDLAPLGTSTGPVPAPEEGPGPINPPSGGGGLGGIVGDVLSQIPGVAAITAFIAVIKTVVGDIEQGVSDVEAAHPIKLLETALGQLAGAEKAFSLNGGKLWDWLNTFTIGEVFKSMLEDGLGINTSEFTGDEQGAVHTVDTMLGFALAFTFLCTAMDSAGRGLLANRWPDAISKLLGEIPQSMGLSWALGLTIDEAFKSAQGVILTEAINKQKRPNRIEWPQIRFMLKQHLIEGAKYEELLKKQGFPDEQIDWLRKLEDAQMTVGDIAQLWYRGEMGDGEAVKNIEKLGFSEENAGKLFDLYAAKGENEASVTYRTIARQMFAAHLLSSGQYEAILHEANYPEKMISQDIAAVKLEQSVGRVLQSAAAIKSLYQHGHMGGAQATQALSELNYAPSYITELLQAWKQTPLSKSKSLSQAKVLSYLASGVLTPEDATARLSAMGLDPADVALLVAHPSNAAGTRIHQLTPALVIQAYIDGALPESGLAAAFKAAHVAESLIPWYVDIAHYRKAHTKGSKGGNLALTASEYREAYKYGIISFDALVQLLENLGYSSDNAMVLAEIDNKGPYQPPSPPIFANASAAVSYLREQGFTMFPPTDPTLLAAEQVAGAAGWTWTPPPFAGAGAPPPINPP